MLAVRFLLQKIGCSRRITFLLWLIVAFRLVCPFSFGNGLSVFNLFNNHGTEYRENFENAADYVRIIAVNTPTAKNTATAKNAAAAIWLFGTAVLLILGAAAYIRLDRRLRFATKYMLRKIYPHHLFLGFSDQKYIFRRIFAANSCHI